MVMKQDNSPKPLTILGLLADVTEPIPMVQRVKGVQHIYEGLTSDPEFQAMMKHQQHTTSYGAGKVLSEQLATDMPKLEKKMHELHRVALGRALKFEKDDRLKALSLLKDIAQDLHQAYDDANVCYTLTYPDKLTPTSNAQVFDVDKHFQLHLQHELKARKWQHAVGAKPASLATDYDEACHTPARTSVNMSRTSSHRTRAGKDEYARAVEQVLVYQALISSPAFEKMMEVDAPQHLKDGVITDGDVEYHNVNLRAMNKAAQELMPYVIDEKGERVTQRDMGSLDAKAQEAAHMLEQQMPPYMNFLNDLHQYLYPEDTNQKPFDYMQMLHAAQHMSAQRMVTKVSKDGDDGGVTLH
jgi:hypothetical protein